MIIPVLRRIDTIRLPKEKELDKIKVLTPNEDIRIITKIKRIKFII